MLVAVLKLLNITEGRPPGAGWIRVSYARELLVIYIVLILVGPCKYQI